MEFSKRSFIKLFGLLFFYQNKESFANEKNFVAVRTVSDLNSTRITIETKNKLRYKTKVTKNKNNTFNLNIEIEGLSKQNIAELINTNINKKNNIIKIYSSYKKIKNQQNKNIVNISIDYKDNLEFKIFNLKPMQKFKERLVIDLFHKKKIQKYFTVAIDAGHGGQDPGAIGPRGTFEKNITLSIARKIKVEIDKIDGFRGVLIREGDYFIPLYERIEKAHAKKADIFISIHADAAENKQAKGSSVYILSENGASSANAKFLEEKENLENFINLKDNRKIKKDDFFKKTLLDLSFTANINESKELANAILNRFVSVIKIHKAEVEYAGFAVLKSPTIPSVLIETAFISNIEEEKLLNSKKFQAEIASYITKAIVDYFENNNKIFKR